MTIKMT